MAGIILDASVYITCLRRGDAAILGMRSLNRGEPLWLSAVVLEELYAGTDRRGARQLGRLQREFRAMNKLLTPGPRDWSRTGMILTILRQRHGYDADRTARLTNDILIATSVARKGLRLITCNERDFGKIQDFCPLRWQLWKE